MLSTHFRLHSLLPVHWSIVSFLRGGLPELWEPGRASLAQVVSHAKVWDVGEREESRVGHPGDPRPLPQPAQCSLYCSVHWTVCFLGSSSKSPVQSRGAVMVWPAYEPSSAPGSLAGSR